MHGPLVVTPSLLVILVLGLVLVGIAVAVHDVFSRGAPSFEAAFREAVALRALSPSAPRPAAPELVTETSLESLPRPVRRYLHRAGVVGQPRVHSVRATWRGRIRGTPDGPWMSFTAEQHNFPAEPARFFHMRAVRGGLPVDVYHSFATGEASMRVKLLSLVPLVDARGAEVTRAETVTLLNDIALLAPSELLSPAIRWEPIDERSARASYTVGANTIAAVLHFDEAGDLVDFVSDDRLAASPDGETFVGKRWSTPVRGHRAFGPLRTFTHGEGRWTSDEEGEWTYLEIELLSLETHPSADLRAQQPR